MTGLVAGPVQTVEVPVPMTQEEVVHVPKVITQNRVRCAVAGSEFGMAIWVCVEDGAHTTNAKTCSFCNGETMTHSVFGRPISDTPISSSLPGMNRWSRQWKYLCQ